MHQGAYARTLTGHAVELAIILEDALMSEPGNENDVRSESLRAVSQFMVRDVVEAKPWQPISYVRQQMLKHAFSYLPIWIDNSWSLIPEHAVVRYLRGIGRQEDRKKRLSASVSTAVTNGLRLVREEEIYTARPDAQVIEILRHIGERPILVVDPDRPQILVGLLTSSDLL